MRYAIVGCAHELDSLPGCSQIVVSHAAFVPKEKRGEGLGDIVHKRRLNQMAALGYDAALCSCTSSNEAQKKILLKNGWTNVWSFDSSKTGNTVLIWMKNLGQDQFPSVG